MHIKIFEYHLWRPLTAYGIDHPFFFMHADTIFYTWIALIILCMLAFIGNISLRYPNSKLCYVTEAFVRAFINAINQSFGHCILSYLLFITALFSFIFTCNVLLLIPGCEEPTKDLNTTLALAIVSFLYIQKEAFKTVGLWGYIQEYMKFPFSLLSSNSNYYFILRYLANIVIILANTMIGLVSLPLEILSKIATIVSLSFRLFGNIFGGSMIYGLWNQAISGSILLQCLGIGINMVIMIFFGLFEGLIQAFVFSILSLTYLAMAVQHGEIVEEFLHE